MVAPSKPAPTLISVDEYLSENQPCTTLYEISAVRPRAASATFKRMDGTFVAMAGYTPDGDFHLYTLDTKGKPVCEIRIRSDGSFEAIG